MDPNRPHRRPKSRAVEPLPIHVVSIATEEMELEEIRVAGRTRIRNWAANFGKRTRALKKTVASYCPVAKKFSCPVCATKLAAKSCLKRHMRLHTGEKPYKCNSCEEAFTRSDYLRKHERVHIEEISSTNSARQKRCTRMESFNAAHERRYNTRQRVREDAALGHVLQPSLAPKPVKKQLLQQQKKMAPANKQQQQHVSQKKHVLHPKPTPIIRMPLRKTSIPVTTAQTQVEAEDGKASPLPGPSRPGPSSSSFKTCGDCKKIFGTAHDLTVHSLVFHPTKENGIGCGICLKRCRSINLLSQHYLHNHGDSKNAAEEAMFMLLNNFNSAPTSSFQNLAFPASQPAAAAPGVVVDRANIKSDDDDSDVEYVETVIRPPPQTGTEVTSPTRQSIAEKRDHSNGTAAFQQNAGFQRRLESRSVANNESIERNKTKRRFRCDICWRILESGRHFTQHLHAAHPDNMPLAPFRCMDCPKAYYVKDSLTTHRRRHHTTLLCCIFCPSEHVNRKRLNRHMLTRHFNLIQNLE